MDTRTRTPLISFCTVQLWTLCAAHSLATLYFFTTSGPVPGDLLGFRGSMVFRHAPIPWKGLGKQQQRNQRQIPLNNHTRRFPHTVLRQGLRDYSARPTNRAPASQEHTGTGVSPNDELVNMNGPNAPGLGIKLGRCVLSERYYYG